MSAPSGAALLGVPARQVAVEGVRFALHRFDPPGPPAGPPVLLLHGIPETSAAWRDLAPELARDRIVLVPDLKGLGGSEARPPYDVTTMAHELAALVLHELDAGVPTVPGVPNLPGNMPGVPDMPNVGGVPGGADLPEVPDMPTLGGAPGVPGVPGASDMPDVPDARGVPSDADLPEVPDMPNVGGVPGGADLPGPVDDHAAARAAGPGTASDEPAHGEPADPRPAPDDGDEFGESAHGEPADPGSAGDDGDEFGGRVDIVGHDWGGVIGLAFAAERPDLVRRLVVVSGAAEHLDAHAWHVPLFALPALPEVLFAAAGPRALPRMLRAGWKAADPMPTDVVAHYTAAYAAPGRIPAMLAYYRAAVRGRARTMLRRGPTSAASRPGAVAGTAGEGAATGLGAAPGSGKLAVDEVLVVWGAADPHLPLTVGQALVNDLTRQLDPATVRLVDLPGVGHYPVEEAASDVVPLIAGALRRP